MGELTKCIQTYTKRDNFIKHFKSFLRAIRLRNQLVCSVPCICKDNCDILMYNLTRDFSLEAYNCVRFYFKRKTTKTKRAEILDL